MTELGTQLTALVATGAAAAGGVIGFGSSDSVAPELRTAVVIDAAAARDGRELVDARLKGIDAEVRLPRTAAEARTNVRYFDALGYRVVVAGTQASAAASAAGVDALRVHGLERAVAAAGD